ncbi:hypothetical protein [Alteromonas confluentis]|uniref:Uncharacterized protein n=1 Tax=Alteromonas confluentis TaxID=1656094 RepID=A0A1E7Z9F1_9ALTE|nr:hypothetical protein [Alteromonas confluentis]OFC70082.1 hypothetical protein BFC18_15240 [Alteromonas confluentis]
MTTSDDSRNALVLYWRNYGGIRALLASPFFWTAWVLTFLMFPSWTKAGWWDDVTSIMPNLLGFSLGGYAMFLAFGDKKFQEILAHKENGETSALMDVNCAFVHFILLQIMSIVIALIAKAYDFKLDPTSEIYLTFGELILFMTPIFYCISYFVFTYAILATMAATFAIFHSVCWYEVHINLNSDEDINSDK